MLDSPIPAINVGGHSDLSISAHEVSTHAKVLRLRRVLPQLAITLWSILPSPPGDKVGTRKKVISELNAPPTLPPTHASAIVLPQPPCRFGASVTGWVFTARNFHPLPHADFNRRFPPVPFNPWYTRNGNRSSYSLRPVIRSGYI